MSMNSAHNRLKRAEKDFRIRWEQTLQLWRDETARQYNDDFVEPLLARAKSVHEAMVHLESVLTVLRHDCE
jgi:hypothetical protein